jgi:hypothetical protein
LIEAGSDAGHVPWQHFIDPFDRMICDPRQHLAQVVFRIETTQLGGFDEGVGRSRPLAPGIRTGEQPVLPSQTNRGAILPISTKM